MTLKRTVLDDVGQLFDNLRRKSCSESSLKCSDLAEKNKGIVGKWSLESWKHL